jgi:hypothetical protein
MQIKGKLVPVELLPERARPRQLSLGSVSCVANLAECRACGWTCRRETPEAAQSAAETHRLTCKWRAA